VSVNDTHLFNNFILVKVLLTGASGFLGSNVLVHLLAAGHEVVALGRHAPPVPDCPALSFSVGDLSTSLRGDMVCWAEIDAVIHLAASGVKASHRVWADALAVNVVGTQHLLSAIDLYASRKPRVVMARTFYEHLVPKAPALLDNPYIATKLAAATLASSWARHYAGCTTFATVFQVYGPGDDPGNVLSYVARQLKSGQLAELGSGFGLRDWLFIDDAALAFVATLTADASPASVSELDIGSGELVSIRTMAELLAKISGANSSLLRFDPARDRPDVGLALAARNPPRTWRPLVTAAEGLSRLLHSASSPTTVSSSLPL
jgi:nucleoside-diphosphate-sugar epimerase